MSLNKAQKRSLNSKKKLLKVIKIFPGRNTPNYAFKINKTQRMTEKYIRELKALGKIERKGSCRYGGYYVV